MVENKIIVHKAYKYRLFPTDEQVKWLNSSFAAIRWVYNAALEQRKTYFRKKGDIDPFEREIPLDKFAQDKQIAFKAPKKLTSANQDICGLENIPELKWITEVPKDILTHALADLDDAFKRMGKVPGTGFPSYRSVDRNNSIHFRAWLRRTKNNKSESHPNVCFGQNCVKIPKLGRIRYNRHKKFYGDPKTVEICKEGKEYYIILTCKHHKTKIKSAGEAIGIDLGVTCPVMLSNGEHVIPDVGLQLLDIRKRKISKKLSRAKKRSARRLKMRQALASISRKIARRRKSKAHKITTELSKRFGLIAIEDLKVRNMTKSAKGTVDKPGRNVRAKSGLNREILNVAPYQFRSLLEYKAQWYGSKVCVINPSYTSQMCSKCGYTNIENRNKEKFACANCDYQAHADHNAAKNILKKAESEASVLARLKSPSEFLKKSATIKANVSCFQPASALKITEKTGGYIRSGFTTSDFVD